MTVLRTPAIMKRKKDTRLSSVIPDIKKCLRHIPLQGGINAPESIVNQNKESRNVRKRKPIIAGYGCFELIVLFWSCSDSVIFMHPTMFVMVSA